MNPRQIREARRLPRIVVAVRAGVSEPSVRTYEASTDAVSSPIRQKLDPVYLALKNELESKEKS